MNTFKFLLFLFLFCLNSIYSNDFFSPYSINYSNPTGAGMMSLGVGYKESNSALYSNPAFLSINKKTFIDGGIATSYSEKKFGATLPNSAGFFVPIEPKWGFGANLKQNFSQNFPYSEKMISYTTSAFLSYQINDLFSVAGGIGPSVSYRNNIQSSVSLSPFLSFAFVNRKHNVGGIIQSAGKFRNDAYRNSDFLEERLPEFISFGYTYLFKKDMHFYAETRKTFWEKSQFILNGKETKPSFDRGIGAELQFSSGISKKITEAFTLRTGFEMGGAYNSKGKNQRSLGIGIGASYTFFDSENLESYQFHISLQRIGVFSKSGDRNPESLLIISSTCLFN